jgi:tetratricopeptide (TPR) repeat protein
MYNIIPLIIILLCLAVIIFIISKKLPLLASFDVSSIPKEKEAETKQKIMEKRLERKAKVFYSKISPIFKIISNFFARRFKDLSEGLKNLEEKYKKKSKEEMLVTKQEFVSQEKKIENIFKEAQDLIDKEDFANAEKKYIEIIGLDHRNINAYRGLGDLYIAQKNYADAKQTFEHILKLNQLDDEAYASLGKIAEETGDLKEAKDDFLKSIGIKNVAVHYFELAEVCLKMENYEEAMVNLEKALEFEPNNPKYIDLLLTISIILKDSGRAFSLLRKLKEVNPENQKIAEFEKELSNL